MLRPEVLERPERKPMLVFETAAAAVAEWRFVSNEEFTGARISKLFNAAP